MSSKKALKQAQKQAFAKHRSNITSSKFNKDKSNFFIKINKKNKTKKLFES
jgi:phenylpyruvate tautomerase PptA (4-oxalocrotonate tautomerase family)